MAVGMTYSILVVEVEVAFVFRWPVRGVCGSLRLWESFSISMSSSLFAVVFFLSCVVMV